MTKAGERLIQSLEEALAWTRGEPVAVKVHKVRVPVDVDVKAIRQRMKLTQRAFAERFGFPVETVSNWERGHRRPEGAARVLLTVIAREPEAVLRALGE